MCGKNGGGMTLHPMSRSVGQAVSEPLSSPVQVHSLACQRRELARHLEPLLHELEHALERFGCGHRIATIEGGAAGHDGFLRLRGCLLVTRTECLNLALELGATDASRSGRTGLVRIPR